MVRDVKPIPAIHRSKRSVYFIVSLRIILSVCACLSLTRRQCVNVLCSSHLMWSCGLDSLMPHLTWRASRYKARCVCMCVCVCPCALPCLWKHTRVPEWAPAEIHTNVQWGVSKRIYQSHLSKHNGLMTAGWISHWDHRYMVVTAAHFLWRNTSSLVWK